MKAINRIIDQARARPGRIVLSEGDDARILEAAARATRERIARITIVGERSAIRQCADAENIDLAGIELVDPADSPLAPEFAHALHGLRRNKGMSLEDARCAVRDPLCFANLMLRLGHADGSVAGAVRTTADVVRTARDRSASVRIAVVSSTHG